MSLIYPLDFRLFMRKAEQDLMLLFDSVSRGRSGMVTKADFQAAFGDANPHLPVRWLDEFFNDVDFKCDGYISFDEWR